MEPISSTDLAAAGRTLGLAMAPDPFYTWLHPDDRRREAWMCRFMTNLLRLLYPQGHVLATDATLAGVVGLMPPGETGFSLMASVSFAARALLAGGGPPWARLARGARMLHRIEDARPDEPHWYVVVAGVNPAAHGRGVGRQIMEHVVALAASDERPVYLETTNAANPSFYERFGFETTQVVQLGEEAPPAVCMIRRPS